MYVFSVVPIGLYVLLRLMGGSAVSSDSHLDGPVKVELRPGCWGRGLGRLSFLTGTALGLQEEIQSKNIKQPHELQAVLKQYSLLTSIHTEFNF